MVGTEENDTNQKASTETGSSCSSCSSTTCSAANRLENENDEEFQKRQRLESRLCKIQHKIAVISGKGGVGKSTVAVNLAASLALSGKKVGLLDVDLHGPSVPTMLGIEDVTLSLSREEQDAIIPLEVGNMKVMSIGLMLRDQDDAVIWRGPIKIQVIQQFIRDVVWGELDYLIIDSPPGTGDEPLSVFQTITGIDGAVVVTTPQKVAAVDVRKSITFCKKLEVPVLGVIENMSGFVCPKCGELTQIFREGAGAKIAESMGVPFLGSIPIDPAVAEAGDSGVPFVDRYATSKTAEIMRSVIAPIAALGEQ